MQGVGFRPSVFRLAMRLGLTGTIINDTQGVTLELQGPRDRIRQLLRCLNTTDKPPMARLEHCREESMEVIEGEAAFTIEASRSAGEPLSQVTADMATCGDCLHELFDPEDTRHAYPFINCTNCGPRYTIVNRIPYDRPHTTMASFPMCPMCAGQYGDVHDRRFHAQPVACARCGPVLWLTDNTGQTIARGDGSVVTEAAGRLQAGQIVAIKGIGGFHLAVDALNEQAVLRLRLQKRRDHKPFALMAPSVATIRAYAQVNAHAEQLLMSPLSPIVLLPQMDPIQLAPSVTQGVHSLGFMVPYAPLHHLLFAAGCKVLVMTSANLSDEPLLCKNDEALERLSSVADCFLFHNREISRQVDDSIVHFVEQTPVVLRRSRGYVPSPFFIAEASAVDILATGADLKNTFCLVKRNQLILSEHIGDLADARVFHHYIRSIDHLKDLFDVRPRVLTCDLHPGYVSTQFARNQSDLQCMAIQHHWAHIASCLAEHRETGPVIGLVADGTGYGTDQTIWGCEVLIASLSEFERFGHLDYYPLPGADRAGKEAIRPLMGLLIKAYGDTWQQQAHWLRSIEPDAEILKIIAQQVQKQINCINTSSLGRVFDGVAALLGLGTFNHFDAQLPMNLEAIAEARVDESYPFDLLCETRPLRLDLMPMIRAILSDMQADVPKSVISAKFHNTVAQGFMGMAQIARETTRIDKVALSGGVFCNRYLITRLIMLLKQAGFCVLFNRDVPSNDGGIALGQAAIAATRVNKGLS